MNVDDQIELVRRLVAHLKTCQIQTAVIGGTAVAYHGYERATEDIDLATFEDFNSLVAAVDGFQPPASCKISHNAPDSDDPLGGVITLGSADGSEVYVQLVNFLNMANFKASNKVAKDAISSAIIAENMQIPFVDKPHLIALKVMSAGYQDIADIKFLLQGESQASINEIRTLCKGFRLDKAFAKIFPDAP